MNHKFLQINWLSCIYGIKAFFILGQDTKGVLSTAVFMDCRDRSLGQFRDFKRDDFETDWIKVAEGRFGQVYQVKVKLWREKCALKTFDAAVCNNFYRYVIH